MRTPIAGIFVGGASSRMGRAKGLLPHRGATVVDRLRAACVALELEVVLVGRREEYAAIELPQLADEPTGVGPIGGLAALLAHAGDHRRAIALACDMPFVATSDLEALITSPDALAIAPRREGRWEPLCAIYGPGALPIVRARIVRRELSLQGLLDALDAREITIARGHLDDWDRPEDIERR